MNWITELCDLYDKNAARVGKVEYMTRKSKKGDEHIPLVLLPVFHTTVASQITVDIDEKGNFLGAEKVSNEDKLTIIPVTETSGSRTAGIEAHPLCDNLKYLAGDYMEYSNSDKKDFSKNHQLYMEGLKAWHLSEYTHKKVNAIYLYLSKGCLIADLVQHGILILGQDNKLAEKEKIQGVNQADAFVRFGVIGEINVNQDNLNDASGSSWSECWLDRTLQESYIQYCRSVLIEVDICYLTGDKVPVSYLQPKKIRNEGDGAKLISSNDESNFTFRGRFADKTEAFAIGYETSQKAHNALKWIIRRQGYNWDGLCIVIWESDMNKIPEWSADTDTVCDKYEKEFVEANIIEETGHSDNSDEGWGDEEVIEEVSKYRGTGEGVASRFRAAMQGYGKNLSSDSEVQLLSFDAATTGRLAMTEYKKFASNRYIGNIQYWHDSCEWLQSKYKEGHHYTYIGMAGIKDIAEALYGTEQGGILTLSGRSRMYAEVCKRLLPCISERAKIPGDMVNQAVRRASSPVSFENRYNWERVLSIACSFVKKQKQENEREVWKLENDELSGNRDYLYGMLLAVADRIEYRTFDRDEDGKRVTNARRCMNAFSQHPYQTWKVLEEKIQPYLQKLELPERNAYNKILDEIYNQFDVKDFADNDRLEGLYLLGYHSQSYKFRYKKENEEGVKVND
ncbi:type I-C CRISPR-associated protein Cas8c/Csd1 [Clostridium sp. C105KSO13]|uniref:type I-C CRISPR-associated protein Cas8c/Csd1 n=1 Tax=Clostridium sp. C105KSO13 TaxID=1776045 RepID=UPI0007406B43|nr:type I-C CRISPR-associated protein Cas8c/Csd1 [Clostridium sp. C105KSO13]CUX17745.1 CRISPR-associated protein (Cas_Csd1) [Clostridium sp. C105KSO13]